MPIDDRNREHTAIAEPVGIAPERQVYSTPLGMHCHHLHGQFLTCYFPLALHYTYCTSALVH